MTIMSGAVMTDKIVRGCMDGSGLRKSYPKRFSLRVRMQPFPVDRLIKMLEPFRVLMTSKAQNLYAELEIYENHRGGLFKPGSWQTAVVTPACLGLTNHASISTLCRAGDNRTDLRFCPPEMVLQIATSEENRPSDGEKWIICSDPSPRSELPPHLFTVIPEEGGVMIGTIDPQKTIESHHRFVFTSHLH